MPRLNITVPEERRLQMMSEDFTFDAFMNKAAENGWTEPEDRELLKNIFDRFAKYREGFNSGKDTYRRNTNMSMLSHIMDTKLSEETPYTAKSDLLDSFRNSRYTTYGSDLDKVFIDYKLSRDQENKRAYESYGTNKQKFISDVFDRKYDSVLREEGDMELMEQCYDAIFDKNGNYYDGIETAIKHVTYSTTGDSEYANRKKFFGQLHAAISRVPEDDRSDAQKAALEKLDYQLEHGIDFIQQRDEWTKMAFEKGYMHSPTPLLKAFFEAGEGLPEDHPYRKVLKELEEGKVEEYPGIDSHDCPHLVMNTIIDHAKAELTKMPDTPQKAELLSQIEDYVSPGFLSDVQNQLEDYPAILKLKSFTSEESKANIKAVHDTLKASKNASGNGESKEFEDMLRSMEEFLNANHDAPLGSFAGRDALTKTGAMEDRIIGYAISEKNNPFNELVPLSIDALRDVNTDKAQVLKAEVCKNILTELDSKKKSWYDRKDTQEYTNFRNAVKTLSEVTDENSEAYKNAVDDLKKYAKEYIDAKNLSKTATQEAGELRKKMAVLAYSLVEPKTARQMIDEANLVRKAKNQINLKDLEKKADAGNKFSSQAEKLATDAKKYVEERQKERHDRFMERNNKRVDKLGDIVAADEEHRKKIDSKDAARKNAKREHIGKIKAEADAKYKHSKPAQPQAPQM